MPHIFEMANPRAKPTAIGDSGTPVEDACDVFDNEVFKVMLGSFGALVIFRQIQYSKWCSYSYEYSTTPFIAVSRDSPHKSYFLEF